MINTVTNVDKLVQLGCFVQHIIKTIHGNYDNVQRTIMSIWGDQETQDGVETVDPEEVVEEKEDGTRRRIPTQRRRKPLTRSFYLLYCRVQSMSGCQHMNHLEENASTAHERYQDTS